MSWLFNSIRIIYQNVYLSVFRRERIDKAADFIRFAHIHFQRKDFDAFPYLVSYFLRKVLKRVNPPGGQY